MLDNSKILILTGFEDFLNLGRNPSALVAQAFDQKMVQSGVKIKSVVLPVDYMALPQSIDTLLDDPIFERSAPVGILSLGLASNRQVISLEKVSLNLIDSSHPDNAGRILLDTPILAIEQNAYFSTLPIGKIVKNLEHENFPCEISYSAGTYLCNMAMFLFLKKIQERLWQIPCGFVHLPPDQKLDSLSDWSFEKLQKSVLTILQAMI